MKDRLYILIGGANLIHGLMHIVQFFQAIQLATYSYHDDGLPIGSIFWALLGLLSLGIGIYDYRHHRKCETIPTNPN